jgi:hypothetical protein
MVAQDEKRRIQLCRDKTVVHAGISDYASGSGCAGGMNAADVGKII